jgi:flagellar M-ring protein FliF
VGFELMDNARFGQTQFQERLNFQRALEGELTRTIQRWRRCRRRACTWRCRNQNGFFREQQKPRRRCC